MRVSFNPAVSYAQTARKQKPYQSQVSFQAAKPKKIFSREIFSMEEEIKKVWNQDGKYKEVLKKYAHIDINSTNCNGDTIFSKALREKNIFFSSLIWMEKRGEIEGIDWNFKDRNGDNLLMIAFKSGYDFWKNNLQATIDLANEGKIDVNYVNEKEGYSLPQLVISTGGMLIISNLFELKDLDVTKKACNGYYEPIVELAIKKGISTYNFLKLVCHPSMDITKYNAQALISYINSAPDSNYRYNYNNKRATLSDYEKKEYKSAIETALKVNNSRKTAKYYEENGMLTLDQIVRHVNCTIDIQAINMNLNETGQTIAHFLAETYVDPDDTSSVEKVKEVIKKMRSASCYFWKEDSLGRSPLMLALEARNFVVAKAMMEKMHSSEFKHESWGALMNSIRDQKIDHIPVYWNLIADLDPKERKEFGTLFLERINPH